MEFDTIQFHVLNLDSAQIIGDKFKTWNWIVLCCSVVRMADPHSAFGDSRLGSENPKTLAKNNKEWQNEFMKLEQT